MTGRMPARPDRSSRLSASRPGAARPTTNQLGKRMRPDVAAAFDRMATAAREEAGLFLSINSAFRSDTWRPPVARPGKVCRRALGCGTPIRQRPGWLRIVLDGAQRSPHPTDRRRTHALDLRGADGPDRPRDGRISDRHQSGAAQGAQPEVFSPTRPLTVRASSRTPAPPRPPPRSSRRRARWPRRSAPGAHDPVAARPSGCAGAEPQASDRLR